MVNVLRVRISGGLLACPTLDVDLLPFVEILPAQDSKSLGTTHVHELMKNSTNSFGS